MADERLGATLQLSVLAALCFDEQYGSAIAAQVNPGHFDNVYRDFAHRVLSFRRRYQRPPGENYLDDLAAQVNFGKDNLLSKRLVPELLAHAEGLNGKYIAGRVQDFIERQILKGAIIEAGDRYALDDDQMVPDVKRIFHNALTFQQQTFHAGTFLNDPRGLQFIDSTDNMIALDIPELDRIGVGLRPKEMMLYVAPKGTGKSWFCVHAAKCALLQRHRVVHYSLEMEEDRIVRRYYQALFGAARRPDRYSQAVLEFDKLGRLTGYDTKRVKPRIALSEPEGRKALRAKMKSFGTRLGGLVVKDFPSGSLTCDAMEAHLDYLADVVGFIPSVIIVDYPDLMNIPARDYRIGLGRTFVDLRGIAGKRNAALLVPTQGTRKTIGAKKVRSSDAAEDITKVNTADVTITYSRTEQEERLGLGRLSVEHSRDTEGKMTILLAQSYTTGQYVTKSALLQKAYWDQLSREDDTDDERYEDDE